MKKRRNRRTLKKRIRRALSLTACITVFFLGGILSLISFALSKGFVAYQSKTICESIMQEINSGNAARILNASSIELVDFEDRRTLKWVDELDDNAIINDVFRVDGKMNSIYIIIEIEDKIAYTNEHNSMDVLTEYYDDTIAVRPIMNIHGQAIGSVTVKVNQELILAILIFLFGFIFLLACAALIIAKILGLFLVIPIINPINQLEKKVKAIAEGDQETASSTQLVLKRPLREIESLADSTNAIMSRLHGYNEQLESQKETLENQNSELEAQNEELLESKLHIQQQQGQLIQSEKMASVGMLTAAITHEINTPIGAINSNSQMEDMLLNQILSYPEIQNNEELSAIFSQMKEVNDVNLVACSRIVEIIKSLKTYSRLDQSDYKEANINEGIKSVLVLTHNLLKSRIVVQEDYGDLPLVKCYPGQLNQVIMNIVVNSSQAIEGEGVINIRTYQKENDIYISIKDTGMGIKPEDIRKLFDPGFTTKGVGVGLGLGLYLSYNIIQNHKGEISVISEPGMGAEFIIKIPMDNTTT